VNWQRNSVDWWIGQWEEAVEEAVGEGEPDLQKRPDEQNHHGRQSDLYHYHG
jgi:hypothetical protein